MLVAISQTIEQFRRINLDEDSLKGVLEREHRIIVDEHCIYVSYQRKEHSIFDLFQSLAKFDARQALGREERETFYFFYYLLSIIKILLSNRTDQLIESEYIIKDSPLSFRQLVLRLSQEYLSNPNIHARTIILDLIYELSAERYHREFITYNKLSFIVYTGVTLEATTPLSTILKLSQDNILDWILSKEQLVSTLKEVLGAEWEVKEGLIPKLRFFTNLVNLLTVMVITSTYDLETLNLVEEFGLTLATIYYRKRGKVGGFAETRGEINKYLERMSFLVVEGVKSHLDRLILKLSSFFDAVLTQKKRLYVYPLHTNR